MQMFARNERLISETTTKRDIVVVMFMSLNRPRKVLRHKSEMQREPYRCIKPMHFQDQLHLVCVRPHGLITRGVDQHNMYCGAVARYQAKST